MVFSLPFGTRILLGQFTVGFHEYEAVFLYASDILMVLFLFSAAIYSNVLENIRIDLRGVALIILLLAAAFSVIFAYSMGLAVYNFIRLALLLLVALAIGQLIRNGVLKIKTIFAVIGVSAVFQSLIGIAQFFKQSSLGLGILGESVLGPTIGGAAKIIVEGAPILRAYGTLPHPNVLGAFLTLGLLGLCYLFSRNYENIRKYEIKDISRTTLRDYIIVVLRQAQRLIIPIGIFIVMLGLVLTFSRSAWLITGIITLIVIIIARNWKLAVLVSAIALILFSILNPYILSRAKVFSREPAVSYRLAYNQLGLNLIKNNLLGVGIGNQVLHSVKNGVYQQFGMNEVWQWQPVHNVYLLIATEIGIVGLLAFLFFVSRLVILNFNFLILNSMFVSLLLFGLADHFLWTLQPGRLMLWLVIGILLASAHSTMDSARPSEG